MSTAVFRGDYPGTALLIFLGSTSKITAPTKYLSTALPNFIGARSYSLYLWHWPLIIFFQQTNNFGNNSYWIFSAIFLTFLLSEFSYRFIEVPSRRLNLAAGTRKIGAGIALGLMTISAATALTLKKYSTDEMNTPNQIQFLQASKSKPMVYDTNCHLGFFDTEFDGCSFGNISSEYKVILIGDSHAAQWFPALNEIALTNNWKLISITKSACPPINLRIYNDALSREYSECSIFRNKILKYIKETEPQLVVLTQSAHYLNSESNNAICRYPPINGRKHHARRFRFLVKPQATSFYLTIPQTLDSTFRTAHREQHGKKKTSIHVNFRVKIQNSWQLTKSKSG